MFAHFNNYQDPVGEAGRLAAFLGARTDPDFLRAVCDACSFSNLMASYQNNKQVTGPGETPLNYAFRKGKIISAFNF